MKNGDYSKTYWNNKGKHEELAKQLRAMIPAQGEVTDAARNPALEQFRSASNCYYDLYNNGLCNRKAEFRKAFGYASKHRYGSPISQTLIDDTEEVFNVILLDAAMEQGLLHYGCGNGTRLDKDACNGSVPHQAGEVRLLPYGGGGNTILCRACFKREMQYRRDAGITVNLPQWDSLKVYGE